VPDFLVEVKPGAWYGWPDFMGDTPITDPRFAPETGEPPTFILANHDGLPPSEKPLVEFVSHSAATRFAADPRENGELLAVALFGDETPMTAAPGSPVVGRAIVLVRTCDWQQHVLTTTRIRRPIDIQFNPVDGTMWVLDFGAFEMEQGSSGIEVVADGSSGCIWRVETRQSFPAE
jgi:hypothetical protein